jgi:hypothetical protein
VSCSVVRGLSSGMAAAVSVAPLFQNGPAEDDWTGAVVSIDGVLSWLLAQPPQPRQPPQHTTTPQPVPQSPVPRELLDPSDRSFVTYSWNFFIREITSGNEHKKYSIRASENSAAALQKNTFHRTNSQRDRPTESDALRPDHVLPSERLATAAG